MGKVSRMAETNGDAGVESKERPKAKRSRRSTPRDAPPQRSSVFRGVTRHRWTGRYEAHLWDKSSWNESQKKKGRQVYLGAYEDEEAAAHAYDLAALKYWGQDTILNFPPSTYLDELKEMEEQTKEEYIGSLRRKSSGFSRGVSKYRGVARHHHNGRWEARIGRVFGNKYLYLGTYATQEEAATAYDMAAIEYRGLNAVTNFDLSRYIKWLRPSNPKSPCSASDSTYKPNLTSELGPIHSQGIDSSGTQDEAQVGSTGSASSALGLLLKSSKYKEMMERTSSEESASTPTTELDESSPLSGNQPRCSFPDDVQTYFECHDSSSHSERDEIMFGDLLNSFMPMMFTEEELNG